MSPMDATTATDSYKVIKFNGDNFHLWKFKMMMALEDKDLWDIVSGVEAVGAPVSEEDLVITLLCRLPGSYDVLITALESRSDALTWRFVTSRLLHEETKRKEQGNDGMKSAAFLTRQEKMKRFPCKICGQMGHWTNKCDRRGEKKQSVAAMAKEESDYLFMASGVEESASSG
ncbi:hypothetical protein Ae201684P_010686 [Aphanomyces euteiches]|uniref:CCHC-type domain-containing protein n=1 Tax=Aphanomyces euteiches TaxID=100861 RepID=A0A6G0WI17_9STRA|nr:hypothetical protein Ae201684_014986 [Aphanomyces euteiches]KAH9076752.1 hypothetical protein Ae201684P_010686 [Aphanomyces euteiches]KAH9145518.1 hypothetical protein AeRB84_010560 [Aphanomyces euteiches]